MKILLSIFLMLFINEYALSQIIVKKFRHGCGYESESMPISGGTEVLVDNKGIYEFNFYQHDFGDKNICEIHANPYDGETNWKTTGNKVKIKFSKISETNETNYIVITRISNGFNINMNNALSSMHCKGYGELPKLIILLKTDSSYCDEVSF